MLRPAATAAEAAGPPGPDSGRAPEVGAASDGGERDERSAPPIPLDTPFLQEDLPPDFWDDDAALEPPAATGRDRGSDSDGSDHRPTAAVASREVTDRTAAGKPVEAGIESLGGTFATLRQLFPGRVLDVEPVESDDDALAAEQGAAGYPGETEDAAPGDAGAEVAEVDWSS